MRLIVGLGNPGKEYEDTRHNLGYFSVERVAEAIGNVSWRKVEGGLLAEVWLAEKHLLFKPTQFMNRSGLPVRKIMDYYRISSADTCVIADDVYLEPGTIRIRQEGGSGGNNGWKSVLEHIEDPTFWRVRIGAGVYSQKPEERQMHPPLEDYVLQPLPPHERKRVLESIDRLVPNLVEWLRSGMTLQEETVHAPLEKP